MDVSEILKFLQQGRQEDREEAKRREEKRRQEDERRRQEDREEAERREEKRRQEDERRRQDDGVEAERRRQEDRDEAERRHQEICESQQVINTRLNECSGRIDGVEQQIDQVGIKVNRIEKDFQNNKEEMERKLEDTKRQVQREILEKIEGLGHQLHRTSIAHSGDYSTSPGIPLQNSTLMHAERSVHKMLKPPTYDGQSSWSMYRRQFEAAAKANGWTSQEMATSLVISLRGQALEILQSIPEEQQNDRIIGALEIRYGHKYLRQVYQSQIKSRQQRSNESLQEYEADIERLIHLAYPQALKEFLEQTGIQTFIDGLVDTEMQQALRLGRHTTISDAFIAALEFKAAKEASRSYKTRVRQKEVERRKWDIKDFTAQDWSFPNPRPKTSFQITSEKFGKRQLVDARNDERSLIVHGYLDDKWCSFVIDTGATRTILRPDILPKSLKELSRHVKLETATGELIPVHGELNVKIQLGSKIMHHRVLTADIRDDCILGLDILKIVMAPKLQDYNKSRRIIVEEDIQIPQGSENIIIAKLDGNGLSTGIVEASERNDGLLVARSLVQMNNQIPVRIANISDKKIILKKNEVLGSCEPVERVVKCEEVNRAQLNQTKKGQKKDSEIKLIRNWVKNGVRPTWQEVSRYGTTIKGYWAQCSSLCLRDGLLHRKWESPDGVSAVYQLVLPKARIHQVLEELHSSPSGGHFGVTRTLARVRDRIYWVNCRRDVEECEKLKMHSDKMKQRLDSTSTETAFKPGDAVWLYAPKRTKGKSPKLQSNWEGSYTIIKKINDLVYRIQLSPRSKLKVVHLERLARYTGHNPPDWFVVEDPPPRTEDSVIRDE
ncbi:hypothetical protein NQ318_018208 [Aromia moschata]|uniref:Peptidase A2 domain-containing protein n=1 Tax=Aromia moschata TaxID=1265417 RepID=A0AAV8ZDD4_9CUCU|nr:hypothetical protein NQ318_018208 [Aromia moschata]